MKKLSLALLLSSSLFTHIIHTNPDVDKTDITEQKCDTCRECQSNKADANLTWESVVASNYFYVELSRTDATEESWARMCEIVELVIPESNAQQVGAESDILACTIKRNGLSDEEWDGQVASMVLRVKELITELENANVSGATLQATINYMSE